MLESIAKILHASKKIGCLLSVSIAKRYIVLNIILFNLITVPNMVNMKKKFMYAHFAIKLYN